MGAHLTAPPPVPSQARPGLPPALDAVVARGMAKRPADRYPTAGAFADAVRSAVVAPKPPIPTWQHTMPSPPPLTPPRPMAIPTAPYAGPPTGRFTGPAPVPTPPPARPPKSQRARWIALCGVLAGIVVVALVITYVVTRDRTTETGDGGSSTTAPPPTTSRTPAPPSTTEPKPAHDMKLYDALPPIYKQYSCVDAATPAGAAAAVECTDSNIGDIPAGNVVFPQPTGARFLRFADAAAMDAFFQNVVKTQGLSRNDAQGACRPTKVPKIWGTYYRAETRAPLPGDYLTCFLGNPAQLVWTDGKNLVAGVLLSTKVTNNDQLEDLYYWWNMGILVDMAGG
jgi:serine/threonine-protein kinase